LKATRDADDDEDEPRPSAKFSNEMTTWTTRSDHNELWFYVPLDTK